MQYAYFLKSKKDRQSYTCFTENLKLRFEQKAQILFNRVEVLEDSIIRKINNFATIAGDLFMKP